ncbi:hypothetical protein ACIA6D_12960 [Streptomyces cacaoi]|uniref:hypothetical protein n=1 Tax=Streptomyces cacaoi TaxID=1898 RepID=UPI003747C8EF
MGVAESGLMKEGLAEVGLAEVGVSEAGLAEVLEDFPEPHPVTTRAAEATTAAITEPRIPNLFQRMCPFPFLFVFSFAFSFVFTFAFAFSYRMPPPGSESPRASALGTHSPACRPSTQTERAGPRVLVRTDL